MTYIIKFINIDEFLGFVSFTMVIVLGFSEILCAKIIDFNYVCSICYTFYPNNILLPLSYCVLFVWSYNIELLLYLQKYERYEEMEMNLLWIIQFINTEFFIEALLDHWVISLQITEHCKNWKSERCFYNHFVDHHCI